MTWAEQLTDARHWADLAVTRDGPYLEKLRDYFPEPRELRRALVLTALLGPDRAFDVMMSAR